jgi:hypothetical protein
VYSGAPDIEKFIPKNCFVSYTDFEGIAELQEFLAGMSYNTYIKYLLNADRFLNSPSADEFRTEHFIETVYRQIKP